MQATHRTLKLTANRHRHSHPSNLLSPHSSRLSAPQDHRNSRITRHSRLPNNSSHLVDKVFHPSSRTVLHHFKPEGRLHFRTGLLSSRTAHLPFRTGLHSFRTVPRHNFRMVNLNFLMDRHSMVQGRRLHFSKTNFNHHEHILRHNIMPCHSDLEVFLQRLAYLSGLLSVRRRLMLSKCNKCIKDSSLVTQIKMSTLIAASKTLNSSPTRTGALILRDRQIGH